MEKKVANEHQENLTVIGDQEMQIKTTGRYHHMPPEQQKNETWHCQMLAKVQIKNSCVSGQHGDRTVLETICHFLINSNLYLSYDLMTPHLEK